MNPLSTLYPHQKEAIEKLNSGKILVGGVGSGKTRTSLAYYWKFECDRMRRPKPLYVITTAKKRDTLDWQGEAVLFGLSTDESISKAPFVVDSWNNIGKYEAVRGAFFIFDEQRLVGSGAWVKSFLKIAKANRWILLSATPGDRWLDYIPVFVANGFYRNRTDFIMQHVVYSRFAKYPKVQMYINTKRLVEYKEKILVYMPFARLTTRHINEIQCLYNKELFSRVYKDRWNPFKERPIMQAGEWCYVMREVVNNDRSRLEAVLDIFEEKQRVIVFYNFDYELEMLKDGLGEYLFRRSVPVHQYNGHVHEECPTGEQWVYLVQYNAASEAWECITTDTIVFYSLNYSYKIMEQAAGRIDRMNTPYTDLHYYLLTSMAPIDRSIIIALRNKKDFNEGRMYRRRFSESS